jgi:hypothetical protein
MRSITPPRLKRMMVSVLIYIVLAWIAGVLAIGSHHGRIDPASPCHHGVWSYGMVEEATREISGDNHLKIIWMKANELLTLQGNYYVEEDETNDN